MKAINPVASLGHDLFGEIERRTDHLHNTVKARHGLSISLRKGLRLGGCEAVVCVCVCGGGG